MDQLAATLLSRLEAVADSEKRLACASLRAIARVAHAITTSRVGCSGTVFLFRGDGSGVRGGMVEVSLPDVWQHRCAQTMVLAAFMSELTLGNHFRSMGRSPQPTVAGLRLLRNRDRGVCPFFPALDRLRTGFWRGARS
jgi:hypothetical protein